ncbi:MAG: ABC transporter substrate-binding protein [Dehalococcoidales bacterium]|nr:MAG: ABC transporter substrate-binding protein [Dehalococcoidales bacterium]
MVKKTIWILVSCLIVLSLVIASCGGDADDGTTTEPDKPTVTEDTPNYGGTFTRIRRGDINNWDYGTGRDMFTINLMGEELLMGDWKRGPAGTNDNDWSGGFAGFISMLTGKLAESWEMPDDTTLLYHIRPGVHWWDKAPANGRELTADDIAWNIMRHFTEEKAYLYNSYVAQGKAPTAAVAIDDYTVEVTVPAAWQGLMATVVGDFVWHICPDAMGPDGYLADYMDFIGTGPFMISEYTPASFLVFEKNPNYWQTDPLNAGNKLPYPDTLKELIIADKSTQLAAFRTAQVDMMSFGLTWEDVELLESQNPKLMTKANPASSISMIWPRLDNENLPFDDINVRYAMNLAVNQQEVLEDYYGGHADMLGWPYPNLKVFSPVYTPLEEQSQIVQDLFGYDPERAKQLLAEAGYPNGFQFEVTCSSAHSDYLAIYKEYLAEVGIDMTLANLEGSVYFSMWLGGTYEEAIYANDYVGNAYRMMCMTEGSVWNYSRFKHQRTEDAVQKVSQAVGKDDDIVARELKAIAPWELEQAVPIYMPSPHAFVMWWPWLQNFYGATGGGGYSNLDEYLMYIWIDTDLKAEMGH